MDEKQIKTKLQELIDDFKEHYEQYKKELEANTETKLVEPLFELLGWTKKDFVKQVKARRETRLGHADYAFYIGDKIVFFLEVKKVGIPLEREADKQVISYALSKRVSFAVSTNFEELKIFCVEQEDALRNKFRVFNSPEEYLTNFNDLLFLSKESFEQGLTLKKAEGEGRLKRRVSIDKSLLEDLMHMRSLIASDIEKNYSGKYQINEKDEIIQRIIDRLIFIRRCEDTGINIENLTLREVQELPDNEAYHKLKEIFKRYNDVYNSGLFAIAKDNDCDKITINGEIIKKMVQYLYESKDEKYIYNFDWIDADVLGQVYEQYLGKLLAQTRSGKAKLTNGQAHRKEQGIYYTPTYIVDYIVKNTVGELLKNKKVKAKDLKILDPACGSGSFLIKAFDYLYNNLSAGKESKQYRIDSQGQYSIKTEILKNNIYGVDLDQKAVEITKLNLLLKAAEKNRRLPEEIDVHIKHGNSLINDETVAGLNAFKWKEEFANIMNKDGFDVVIGNPPYVKARDTKDPVTRKFIEESGQYKTPYKMWDLYIAFVEKGLQLLKPNGVFAMIIPDTIGVADYTQKLVDMIIKDYSLYQIDFFPDIEIFEGVGIRNKIIFVKKTTKVKKCKRILHKNNMENVKLVDTVENKKPEIFKLETSKIDFNFKNTIPLGHICYVSYGARFNSDKADPIKFKKYDLVSTTKDKIHNHIYTEGKYLERYSIKKELYVEWDTERCPRKLVRPTFPELYTPNKLLMSRQKRITTFSDNEHICDNTVIVGVLYNNLKNVENASINKYLKNIKLERKIGEETSLKFNLKYLLAILNSKLISYFLITKRRSKLDSYPDDWKKIPIKNITLSEQKPFVVLADKLLSLNKNLNEIGDKKTSESARIEDEIKKTDNEIDELVYKLYGLTNKEIDIVKKV